jgi:hypothetical protein
VSGVDLVTFYRARLDHREAVARKAASGCGCHPPTPAWAFDDEATDGRIVIVDDPHPDIAKKLTRRWNRSYDGLFHAAHIALNDPQFVLADVAAKRRIVEAHADPKHYCAPGPIDRDGYSWYEAGEKRWADIPCLHLRLLAAPFAQHPDYDPAWAVEGTVTR